MISNSAKSIISTNTDYSSDNSNNGDHGDISETNFTCINDQNYKEHTTTEEAENAHFPEPSLPTPPTQTIEDNISNHDFLFSHRTFRILPLMIGWIVPISVIVNAPSITEDWVWEREFNVTTHQWATTKVDTPTWLTILAVLAFASAAICNLCILFRFLGKNVWFCIVLAFVASILQDLLCILIIALFCTYYPTSKGYIYKNGFWSMIASMILSISSTILMSLDLLTTPTLLHQDSGLSPRQRILVALTMIFYMYLALGSLIFTQIEDWRFLDALVFVLVTVTTIGFGDQVPGSPGARTFTIFYAIFGIIILGLLVNGIHTVLMEEQMKWYAARAKIRDDRRRAKRLRKNLQLPESIPSSAISIVSENHNAGSSFGLQEGDTLDLTRHSDVCSSNLPLQPTHSPKADGIDTNSEPQQSSSDLQRPSNSTQKPNDDPQNIVSSPVPDVTLGDIGKDIPALCSSIFKMIVNMVIKLVKLCISPSGNRSQEQDPDEVQEYIVTVRKYNIQLLRSALVFVVFWIIGALLFMASEPWSFGPSMYFCFIAFSTIGYGDMYPTSDAGKIIFLVYVLIGILALTWLVSLVSEIFGKKIKAHAAKILSDRESRVANYRSSRNGNDPEDVETQEPRMDRDVNIPLCNIEDNTQTVIIEDTFQGTLQHLSKASKEFSHMLHHDLAGDSKKCNSGSIKGKEISTTHHTDDDEHLKITSDQLKHLHDFGKKFLLLTEACQRSLQDIAAWENEHQVYRRNRKKTYSRQQRFLLAYRQKLRKYEESHALIDNEIDRELDDLDELFDELRRNEEDAQKLEQKRDAVLLELTGLTRLITGGPSIEPSILHAPRPRLPVVEGQRVNLLREALRVNPNILHPVAMAVRLKQHFSKVNGTQGKQGHSQDPILSTPIDEVNENIESSRESDDNGHDHEQTSNQPSK